MESIVYLAAFLLLCAMTIGSWRAYKEIFVRKTVRIPLFEVSGRVFKFFRVFSIILLLYLALQSLLALSFLLESV